MRDRKHGCEYNVNISRPDACRNLVVPGMTLTIDIRTGEKTLAEYLLKPIYKAMSEAFRER